ncbi:MAG TPA: ABC transporter permease [Candidatus Polarisedimenticolia bacterium]|nr:ABC transporter permease [Candidatus Polarisedimenticolia bacterium]
MPQILLLMAKNGLRNKLRTLLTVAVIAVAVIAYSFLQTVLVAYNIGVEASSDNRLVTRHRVSLFNLLPVSQKEKIAAVPGVTQVNQGIWFGGYYKDPKQFFGQIAVSPEYLDLYPEFQLSAEQRQAWLAERRGAVVGRKLAERFGWKLEDRIVLTGTIFSGDWELIIKGIYTGRERSTDETAMFFHWRLIDERLQAAGVGSQVGWWVVGVQDPSRNAEVSDAVDALFINSSNPTLTETEKEFNKSFLSMMGSILTIIQVASGIVIGIILLIMANTMMMAARERITEYGVLKTLGFRASHLTLLIGGEAAVISFLGAAAGCVLAFGLVAVMGARIEELMGSIFPVFELRGVTIAVSIGLAMLAGLAASSVPIVRAARLSIVDSLRRVG